jgi:hypothetical protein
MASICPDCQHCRCSYCGDGDDTLPLKDSKGRNTQTQPSQEHKDAVEGVQAFRGQLKAHDTASQASSVLITEKDPGKALRFKAIVFEDEGEIGSSSVGQIHPIQYKGITIT